MGLFNIMQFWAITTITRGIKIVQYMDKQLLEKMNLKYFLIQRFLSKGKCLKTINKTTESQNVEQRHKSIVHPSFDISHEINR